MGYFYTQALIILNKKAMKVERLKTKDKSRDGKREKEYKIKMDEKDQ